MTDKTEIPATDRTVARTDNNPPEPVGLLVATEVSSHYADAVKALLAEHLDTFLMFLRIPQTIESQEVYDRVTTVNGMVKKAFDKIDKARSTAKKPYLDGGTAVDKAFALTVEIDDPDKPAEGDKPAGRKTINLLAEMKKAHDALKSRQSAYDTKIYNEQEADRVAEAEAMATAAAEDGIVLDTSAMTGGKMQSSRSEHGGTAIKKVEKTFTVTDASLVPANLCSPDPVKIQAAIDAGATTIPGVAIETKVKTHVR